MYKYKKVLVTKEQLKFHLKNDCAIFNFKNINYQLFSSKDHNDIFKPIVDLDRPLVILLWSKKNCLDTMEYWKTYFFKFVFKHLNQLNKPLLRNEFRNSKKFGDNHISEILIAREYLITNFLLNAKLLRILSDLIFLSSVDKNESKWINF